MVFLEIVIDTIAGELHFPTEKLQRLQSLLHACWDKRACSCKELESLIRLLNHACKVVRPGHSFLYQIIGLQHSTHCYQGIDDAICLNMDFQADLAWWREFVRNWNGTSFLLPSDHLPAMEVAMKHQGRGVVIPGKNTHGSRSSGTAGPLIFRLHSRN